jgi:hypothetical protein
VTRFFTDFRTTQGNRGKGRPRVQTKCKCGNKAHARNLCKRCYRREPDQIEATKRQHRRYYQENRERLVDFQRRLRAENPEAMRAYWNGRRAAYRAAQAAPSPVTELMRRWF